MWATRFLTEQRHEGWRGPLAPLANDGGEANIRQVTRLPEPYPRCPLKVAFTCGPGGRALPQRPCEPHDTTRVPIISRYDERSGNADQRRCDVAEIIEGLKRQNLPPRMASWLFRPMPGYSFSTSFAMPRSRPGRSRHHSAVGDAARRGGHWPCRLPGE